MITIKVGSRGQITLPRAVRRQVGLEEGDRIAVIPQDDQIILQPLTKTLLDLRGSVKVSGEQDFTAIRHQVVRHQVERTLPNDG